MAVRMREVLTRSWLEGPNEVVTLTFNGKFFPVLLADG